ncbi:MAG: LysM domain-containing protein [Desulfitobacteriaceae bacterium]
MFFGKRQPVGYVAPSMMATTMPDGQMMPGMPNSGMAAMTGQAGMVGMPYGPEGAGYAGYRNFLNGTPGMPGMPGFEVSGYAGPGTAETLHSTPSEYDMPCCPPMHYDPCCPPRQCEHSECDLDIEPRPMPHVHIVRKGETVYKIAKLHGLDWRELAGYNHLGNPNLIYPGQRLEIPPRY